MVAFRRGAVSLFVALACLASPQRYPIIEGKVKTLGILPARLMFSGFPGAKAVSPDGRFIAWLVGEASLSDAMRDLATAVAPTWEIKGPRWHLMVYDRLNHSSEDRGVLPEGTVVSPDPMGSDGTFFLQCITYAPQGGVARQSVVLSLPGEHSFTRTMSVEGQNLSVDGPDGYFSVHPSSMGYESSVSGTVTVYDRFGRVVVKREAVGYAGVVNGYLMFTPAGGGQSMLALDLATGKVATKPEQARWDARRDKRGLLDWRTAPTNKGAQPLDVFVKPVDHHNELKVLGGIGDFYFDPLDRFILYSDGDALLVRDIVEIDPVEWAKVKKEHDKRELISRAKQIGTALMIYAADYDDLLPMSGGFNENILPYTRAPDLTQGFVFLLPGASLTSVRERASTMIGFIQGDGGMAVVYADSHVKWIPNK